MSAKGHHDHNDLPSGNLIIAAFLMSAVLILLVIFTALNR